MDTFITDPFDRMGCLVSTFSDRVDNDMVAFFAGKVAPYCWQRRNSVASAISTTARTFAYDLALMLSLQTLFVEILQLVN